MTRFTVFICLISFTIQMGGSAFASESPKQFRVLGRGIENRKTAERIVLVCSGPDRSEDGLADCSQLQHLYFKDENSKPEKVGSPIVVSQEAGDPAPEAFRNVARKMIKNYRTYAKSHFRLMGNEILMTTGIALAVFTAYVAIGENSSLSDGEESYLSLFAGVAAAVVIFSSEKLGSIPTAISAKNTSTSAEDMQDQDGWNWSVSPAKKSNKRFSRYLEWVKSN